MSRITPRRSTFPFALTLSFAAASTAAAQDADRLARAQTVQTTGKPASRALRNSSALIAAVLQEKGKSASVAIYPVQVTGQPSSNVADALGLVLEKYGMTSLELGSPAFAPDPATPWADMPSAFAAFLKNKPPTTAYALYAQYLGDPKSGPTQVRFLVADAAGNLVLSDVQTPADAEFKRTAARDPDPMGCSLLVANRLFSLNRWTRSSSAADGKFARKWAEKSGTPDQNERAAMTLRFAKMKSAIKNSTICVYAPLCNEPAEMSSARLADSVSKQLGCKSSSLTTPPQIAIAPTSNQQKRLWDLARAFQSHLRANPPTADYALIADYLLIPDGRGAHTVHVVVCDKAGDWVIVDFQNNQHSDFQRIAPKTVEDCERLTLERLKSLLAK